MSSRVFEPDSPHGVAPVSWKQLHPGGTKAPAEPAPADSAAREEKIRREFEQKVREAQAAGFREGEAAGRSRAAAEFQPVVERLARTIGNSPDCAPASGARPKPTLLQLALAIARRVLRRELAVDPEALRVAGPRRLSKNCAARRSRA